MPPPRPCCTRIERSERVSWTSSQHAAVSGQVRTDTRDVQRRPAPIVHSGSGARLSKQPWDVPRAAPEPGLAGASVDVPVAAPDRRRVPSCRTGRRNPAHGARPAPRASIERATRPRPSPTWWHIGHLRRHAALRQIPAERQKACREWRLLLNERCQDSAERRLRAPGELAGGSHWSTQIVHSRAPSPVLSLASAACGGDDPQAPQSSPPQMT